MQKITLFTLLLGLLTTQFGLAQNHYNTKDSRGYLGVYSNGVSKTKAEALDFDNTYGSYVTRVLAGSAAEKMGLQVFDYIYAVDEKPTTEDRHLTSLLRCYRPGDQVQISYIRNGATYTGNTTLTRKVKSKHRWKSENEEPFFGVKPNHDDLPRNQNGVRVDIISNSTAETMALKDGDIIETING